MKKIIFAFALILSSMIASAHYITPYAFCSAKNVTTMNIWNWDIGSHNTGYFYATKNGTQDSSVSNPVIWRLTVDLSKYTTDILNDSVGQITSSGFKINIPAYITYLYGYENETGSYNKVVWSSGKINDKSLTDVCIALPLTLDYFGAQQQGNQIVFKWSTLMEINIDHYEIIRLNDDSSQTVVAKISSKSPNGNSTEEVDYSYTMDTSSFLTAGFTSFFAMVLLISIIAVKKNRKILMPAAFMLALAFNFASCTKSEVHPKNTLSSVTDRFILKSVDKNGREMVYNTIAVYIAQPR